MWNYAADTYNKFNNLFKPVGDSTPHLLMYKREPSFIPCRVYGCKASVLITKPNQSKLTPKSLEGKLIGYNENSKNYIIYNKEQGVIHAADVKFDELNVENYNHGQSVEFHIFEEHMLEKENVPTSERVEAVSPIGKTASQAEAKHPIDTEDYASVEHTLETSTPTVENPATQHTAETNTQQVEDPTTTRDLKDTGASTDLYDKSSHTGSQGVLEHIENDFEVTHVDLRRKSNRLRNDGIFAILEGDTVDLYSNLKIPRDPTEVSTSDKAEEFDIAFNTELNNLCQHNVYTEVRQDQIPADKKVIGSRWVVTYRNNKAKCRIVVKGYTQVADIDYHSSYAPVLNTEEVLMIFIYVATHNYVTYQIDISSAFLNADLTEETYVRPPKGIYEDKRIVWK